ncbi:MAG: polysaccharide pyruvyl transferase family protein [Porticoccaceae bacterium]
MKVIYFQDPRGNFGDELNRWLWPRIFDGAISGYGHHGIETMAENGREDLLFYGIGTILNDRIPEAPEKIIFGSGYGYGAAPRNLGRCNVVFVRGRKTADAIGVSADKALTDPALLLRRFFPVVPESERRYQVSFIPHHTTVGGDFWRMACRDLGIHYIDPCGFDVETVIEQISASRLLIAEAMHGAIVADMFRVPWIPVSSVSETNDFKWQDWCGTLDLSYAPVQLTPIFRNTGHSRLKNWLNRIKLMARKRELRALAGSPESALLSDERVLDAHRAAMDERVCQLQDYLRERASGRA